MPPTPRPEIQPLDAIRNELATDGQSVSFQQLWPTSVCPMAIGTAAVMEPTDASPEFAFEAPEPTQLELLKNPGVEGYQISAEFQLRYHKSIVDKGGGQAAIGMVTWSLFGLYCGDVLLETAQGHPLRISLVADPPRTTHSKEVRAKLPQLKGAAQVEAASNPSATLWTMGEPNHRLCGQCAADDAG